MNSTHSEVRRPFHVSSPLMQGSDVLKLQEAMRDLLTHHKIDWLPLEVDGKWGFQSRHAARFLTWVIGLGKGHRDPIKNNTLTKATQHLLRNPQDRSRLERRRERSRAKRLAVIRHQQDFGPNAAVDAMERWEGTTESPAGSNSGPTKVVAGEKGGITYWEEYWGLSACFWCLVSACFFLRTKGAKIPGKEAAVVCVNAAELERSARAHTNGFVAIPWPQRRRGDVILCCFDGTGVPDHGELCRENAAEAGEDSTDDVGGNTSPDGGGSQANGGGVFYPKIRERGLVTCVARAQFS